MPNAPTITPPNIFKQGNAPDQQSGQIQPLPWTDDLWVDIVNHVVKRCTAMNPYVWVSIEGGGGGGNPTFGQILTGDNTSATMTVDTGAILNHAGTGVIDATQINGIPITGALTHAGQIPISQPGNTSAVWADPLVQGIQAAGTSAATVNPVLSGGQGADGNLHNISTDNSGNQNVNIVSGSVSVSNFPATQPVSGTVAVSNFPATQPVSGTVGVTGNVTVVQPTGTNLHVVVDNAPTTTVTGTVSATQGTSPWVQNLTQVAGTALGATAVVNYGTAPAAVAVPAVNAFITNTPAVTLASTTVTNTVTVSGTVTANQGTANTAANAWTAKVTDGTTVAGVIAGTTALKTDLSSVAGTATSTAAAGVQLVGIEGRAGTSLETTAGVLDQNLKNVNNAAVSTAASGVQKVGITGNAAATLDSTIGAATAPTNALATSAVYQSTVPALTAGQAVAAQCDTAGNRYVNHEGRKQTYSCAAVGITPIASATAPTFSVTGSATKTIRITKISFSIAAATGGAADAVLHRFSALSGGTSASQSANIAKHDSGNATATAVVNTWSAAATTATSAGLVRTQHIEIPTAAVGVLDTVFEFDFGTTNGQALVLRGTSEFVGIRLSSIATTPLAGIWVEWTEE